MRYRSGVVIGSYGMPGVVELNIAAIRHTCGPVPILVVDDATPKNEGGSRIASITERYQGVELITNQANMGHAPGDLECFRQGLLWAGVRGLDVLVKFSQRFIITAPGWIQDDARSLIDSGDDIWSQPAYHLNLRFPMRTEAVMMRTPSPELAKLCVDCKTATEDHMHWAAETAGLKIGRWERIPPDRFHRYKNIVWHNTDGVDVYREGGKAYHELAERLGVDLGNEFSAAGWHVIAPNRPGTKYRMFS